MIRLALALCALVSGSALAAVAHTPTFDFYTPSAAVASSWNAKAGVIYDGVTGKYIGTGAVRIGGQLVPVTARAGLTAQAWGLAKTAMRSNPTMILGSAILAYLLSEGLSQDNGQWVSTPSDAYLYPLTSMRYYEINVGGVIHHGATPEAACASIGGSMSYPFGIPSCNGNNVNQGPYRCGPWPSPSVLNQYSPTACPLPSPVAATQADFDALPAPTDAVKAELPTYIPDGVQVTPPVVDKQTGVTVGQPVTKPDGSVVQTKANIDPQPNAQVTVTVYEEMTIDSNGQPVVNPTPEPTETDQDLCEKNPGIAACADMTPPVDSEALPTENRSISITPEAVGGVGACPPDIVVSFMGQPITLSWALPCQGANMIRPLVLAIAWLSAGLVFIQGVRNG